MVRFQDSRAFYIPRPSIKVADKASDAIAYLYERDGRPFAALFVGKQAKPVWHHWFRDLTKREARVRHGFETRRAQLASKAESRAKRRAEGHCLTVGDILSSS
jgi:hypothetical protein